MRRLSTAAREHLERVILPFWMQIRDDTYGGFYGYMGQDLVLDPKWEKGCILNSRILWFFSESAMVLERDDLRSYADHAFAFLRDHCFDRENGGIFWSMTYDGQPLYTTKYTYNQAFALYALSAYHRFTGSVEARDIAMQIFRTIEQHCTDEIGYLEAFTADWQPVDNQHISGNGIIATRTMNTLLHVFEGYSGLYQATRAPEVGEAMRRVLKIFMEKMYSPELHRQLVFFDDQYNSLLDLYSYGHDIEASWLMDWGCDLLGDVALSTKLHTITQDIGEHALAAAFSHRSLANECDRGAVDETRIWWVQAETAVGIVHLLEKNPQSETYREAAADIFHFIEEFLIDPRPGSEWFYSVSPDGVPTPEKPILEPWKCPYHNGRMCLELIKRDPDVFV